MANVKHTHHLEVPETLKVEMIGKQKTRIGENFRFFIGSALIVIGWWVGSILDSNNDTKNKLIELKTQYAINTYNQLHRALRTQMRGIRSVELEDALANVQLFGTPEQISMAHHAAENIINLAEHNLEPLLKSLRNDLRDQVKIPEDSSKIILLILDTASKIRNGFYYDCLNKPGKISHTGIYLRDAPVKIDTSKPYPFIFNCEMCGERHNGDLRKAKLIGGPAQQY